MANPQHVEWLLEGAEAWNTRRRLKPFTPDLAKTKLRGADLRDASLQDSNLRDANMWGADLRGANLWGVDLRTLKPLVGQVGATNGFIRTDISIAQNLSQAQINFARGTRGENGTILPTHFNAPDN